MGHGAELLGLLLIVLVHRFKAFSCHVRFAYLERKSLIAVFDRIMGTWVLGLMSVLDMVVPAPFVWFVAAVLEGLTPQPIDPLPITISLHPTSTTTPFPTTTTPRILLLSPPNSL